MGALLSAFGLKDCVYLGLLLALLGGFTWYTFHERHLGAEHVYAADAKARAEEQAKNSQITAALAARAEKAEGDRNVAQQNLVDFMADHPVGAVRLCVASDSGRRLSSAPDDDSSPENSGSGPDPVPEVPAGSTGEGADIGPELNALVRAAGTMGGLYRQFQQAEVR